MRLRHPPFALGGATSSIDFSSREGATELAKRIREAWAKVGVVCIPAVVPAAEGARTIYGVELPPEFVNGLPPRWAIVGEGAAGSSSP